MTYRFEIIGILVALVVSFAVGRYSAQQPSVKEVTKSEDTKKSTTDTDSHTVIVANPNGSTTTTIDTHSHEKDTDVNKQVSVVSIEAVKPQINLSLLGGYDYKAKSTLIGASINKQFLGPVTLGAFGFNNGVIGLSIGVVF